MSPPAVVAVTGASGLIGTRLVEQLCAEGSRVLRISRAAPASDDDVQWDVTAGRIDAARLAGVDAVVHLAGAGIGDHRWTEEYRDTIRDSRTASTDLIARTIAGLKPRPRVLVSGSAIGYYGDSVDERFVESSPAGAGFLAGVCQAWEAATAPAEDAGIRVAHIRSGIVLARAGGALRKMLPLFKLGLGGRFGTGRQWMSWITLDDHVAATMHLLGSDRGGPVNLTAPTPVTNAEFTKSLARALHRPALLPVPAFGPRLVLGADLADALLLEGQHVSPAVLEADGFRFKHPELDVALPAVLQR